jgi:hypothetical protein
MDFRHKRALAKLNVAELAPIPRAMHNTAAAVNPGFFQSWRIP